MISSALSILNSDSQRNELAEIYELHSDRFYAIAFSKLHNRNDAEDAVAEAFLRIAQKPENFFRIQPHKRVAYIDVIIRNIALDIYKRNNRISELPYEDNDHYADGNISVEELVVEAERKDELVQFIRSLPEGMKSALILKLTFAESTAEIARVLGVSEAAARRRLSDAYKKVHEYVEKGRKDG